MDATSHVRDVTGSTRRPDAGSRDSNPNLLIRRPIRPVRPGPVESFAQVDRSEPSDGPVASDLVGTRWVHAGEARDSLLANLAARRGHHCCAGRRRSLSGPGWPAPVSHCGPLVARARGDVRRPVEWVGFGDARAHSERWERRWEQAHRRIGHGSVRGDRLGPAQPPAWRSASHARWDCRNLQRHCIRGGLDGSGSRSTSGGQGLDHRFVQRDAGVGAPPASLQHRLRNEV
jgi:hypothetical protein